MPLEKRERLTLLNCYLALEAFKRADDADQKEQARRNAINGLRQLLNVRAGDRNQVEPDSPLNFLFAALDHCEAEGMSHSELVAAFNEHAESRSARLPVARPEARI
ncbi:hypothetical protein [Ferrovibrio sp.]|uniref:hypothetical protein n=1 Tax=Ferrovibrio sp. TaxID=1917215 RepID=UPI0035B2B0F2